MKYENFTYHSYNVTPSGFSYHFSMGKHEFRPEWNCAVPNELLGDPILEKLVFLLGMAELVSYWKAACPPIVKVMCGNLTEQEKAWWKKLYRNGLGEFFYINKITPTDDFMTIDAAESSCSLQQGELLQRTRELSGCLIPVGGGKDSIVTLEMLRESIGENLCYIIGDAKRAYDSAKMAGYSDSQILQVRRSIDPMLLELNKRGYLNGHTPFSAIVAFSSVLFAYLSGKKYVVLSNESSANEGNVSGSDINHQYSKSFEFELDFRSYTNTLGTGIEYFSLLRPWNELQITAAFTQYPQYFPIFQSCNVGTKTNTWCCKCAKCLYVYVMLAAFLEDETLVSIFGENLLQRSDLSNMLDALANPEYDKPFECVGTREEVCIAISMAIMRRRASLPLLLRKYSERSALLGFSAGENALPKDFKIIFEKFSKNA